MAESPDSPAAHTDLVAIARALYPHERLADAPYERTATAILDRAATEPVLWRIIREGVHELEAALGTAPRAALEVDVRRHLAERTDTDFFRSVRSLVAWYLYDDHEVWEFVGYPGASFEHGGYLQRGFNDLTWLPEPRVVENEEPLIEIGPLR